MFFFWTEWYPPVRSLKSLAVLSGPTLQPSHYKYRENKMTILGSFSSYWEKNLLVESICSCFLFNVCFHRRRSLASFSTGWQRWTHLLNSVAHYQQCKYMSGFVRMVLTYAIVPMQLLTLLLFSLIRNHVGFQIVYLRLKMMFYFSISFILL
jgi:hypothetical protein